MPDELVVGELVMKNLDPSGDDDSFSEEEDVSGDIIC